MCCIQYSVLASKSPPTPDLIIPVLHRFCLIYLILGAPTISPAIHFCHESILNVGHSVFGFGIKIPAHARSHHPCPPPPLSPHISHPRWSHYPLRHPFLSRVNTKCSAFGTRLQVSKSPCTPDLTVSTLNHRIHPVYTTTNTPTMPPAIYFYRGQVLNAPHSVLGFGCQNLRPCPISPSRPLTTAFTPYTPPSILPPCSPPFIYITSQYQMCFIQFLIFGAKIPIPARSHLLVSMSAPTTFDI
jgi:hypothetical protein